MKENLIEQWKQKDISQKVIQTFLEIPREEFVLNKYKDQAYDDYPLPIGHSATISQPTTVITMTDFLDVKQGMKILEIGTGSGYQAVLLSKLVKTGHVYTTEIIPELIEFAENNLKKLKIKNVTILHSKLGYKKEAPYDRIIVTAGYREIPDELLNQLKINGKMLIPVGSEFRQDMLRVTKLKNYLKTENLGAYVFVPLVL